MDKCIWYNQLDGEYTTQCLQEYYFSDVNLEDRFDVLMFKYCPYCGKEIEESE